MAQVDVLPHPSFETVWRSISRFRPPEGAFDPAGAWVHEYQVGAPVFRGDEFALAPIGKLSIERRPGAGEDFELLVQSQERLESSVTTRLARIRSAADELATPRSWTLETTIADPRNVPLVETRSEGEGRPGQTSNWSLLEAVQRLSRGTGPAGFALLEDLEVEKGDQRIVPAGSVELPLAGGALRVHGHRQVGAGILPWHYWQDDDGRLLFVLSPLKTLVWNA